MTDPVRPSDPPRSDLLDATPPGPVTPRPSAYPTLRDAWPDARPFTLDGWLERNGFSPGWTALLVAVLAFFAYQLAGTVVAAVGVVVQLAGSDEPPDPEAILEMISSDAALLLASNALGQLLGFGFIVWLVVRLHTRERAPFLRLRAPDVPGLGWSVLGWVALYPGLLWLGHLNQFLPQPTWLSELEEMQTELLETALLQSDLGAPFLLLTMALTPAIFEELLFRGYLQRQVERRLGWIWSIVAVGLFFGLYHLRLTQVLPLGLLGAYLGYITWATGSLYAAMAVHLLNNGFAVLVGVYARNAPDLDAEALESATVPWYLGVVSLLAAAGVLVLLRRRREAVVGEAPDAVPAAPEPATPPLLSDPAPPPDA
ncbi:MAG: CPBP family intramembrane glutamic endopeptidase [Rubricoccaceae bacterium]|nr:CPBP family intramembrane glutamic endopeptidase [Rubricoccaceae bacterium]